MLERAVDSGAWKGLSQLTEDEASKMAQWVRPQALGSEFSSQKRISVKQVISDFHKQVALHTPVPNKIKM